MNATGPMTTAQWRAIDTAHHVHPFTDQKALKARGSTIIEKADGCYLWDSDGNRILDGMAGLWCVNVGYGRSELADVARQQMCDLAYYNSFFQTTTPSQLRLAQRIAEITPDGLDHVFFANSGSEANDTVIRLVWHYWRAKGQADKRTFIARNRGYHGSTLAAVALGGMQAMRALGQSTLPGFEQIMEPHHYRYGANETPEQFALTAAAKLEAKILEIGAHKVAAFVAEPVQGAGGVISPPPGYWKEIERICRKYEVLLVADEVICGFGRLGAWFGSQFYDVTPDLMPMAKGLSSGYMPISAVAIGNHIYDTLHEAGPLVHGFTYSGHPVACAVAEANIDIIAREGLVERVRDDIGPYFRTILQQLVDSSPIASELRGEGLLAGIQLAQDKTSKTYFPDTDQPAIFCRDVCQTNGLIVRAVEHALVFCPPLTISHTEVDELAEKTKASLDQTARHFGLA